MELICDLLFELSNTARLEIMYKLQDGKQRLSHLSNNMDLTISEISRHLQRLSDSKLIQKDPNGSYLLTPYGENVLSQLQGFCFIAGNSAFFNDHDLSFIPYEFRNRIGELAKSSLGNHVFIGLEEAEKAITATQKQMWILTDMVFNRLAMPLVGKLSSTFDCRIILPASIMPRDNGAPIPSTAPGVQKRVLPEVNVVVLVSDEDAVFCVPQLGGKMDYTGFRARDPVSYKWCRDLFLYFWDKAMPSGRS